MTSHESEVRRGTGYGASAYLLWGVLPLYFPLLAPTGALEILFYRVLATVVVCLLVVTALRQWRQVRAAVSSGRRLGLLAVAALLVTTNWAVFIYGVEIRQVVQVSLGYYVNPLVTVLLGVVVLRERLRPLQWTAVGVGALAVVVLTVDFGALPWISLLLATSFALYGLAKNRVGRTVGALASLSVETAVVAPLALAGLVWLSAAGLARADTGDAGHMALLAGTGVITAVPLLFFASAARRVPLSTIGLLQYIAPSMQLVVAVLVFGEDMPASRWAGFALVWAALALLTLDMLRAARGRARVARAVAAAAAAPA